MILFLLLGWGGFSWLNPKFPSSIAADPNPALPRELVIPTLSRQTYSKSVVKDVSQLNVFRKQRRKYYRPKPPKPKLRVKRAPPSVALATPTAPPKPTVPPPQLVLTGVLLFGDQKVAIFEGTYSDIRGGRLIQNLKPRRRGYKTGEFLGKYRIKNIDQSHATLSSVAGNNLTLTLSKTPPAQKIRKSGNQLIQKSKPGTKNFSTTPPTRQTRRSQPVPVQRIPGNRISSPAPAPPAVMTPTVNQSIPNPLNSNRLQQLRQKALGVLKDRE